MDQVARSRPSCRRQGHWSLGGESDQLPLRAQLTGQDVELAKKYGADAVVLSNHGGRQLDLLVVAGFTPLLPSPTNRSANAPLKTLYDVRQNAPHLLGRSDFSVFIDGGIRRGTDVLKALCLGANAVGLGRPFIYAGTGWGSEGVEKTIMRACRQSFAT